MLKNLSKCRVLLVMIILSYNQQTIIGQNRSKHSVYFSANPYTYVFNEKLGDWNSGASWPLEPSYAYKYAFTSKYALFFKHIAMRWSPKLRSGIDTSFLYSKVIYSNTLGYMRTLKMASRINLALGIGISYNRRVNAFYGDFNGHFEIAGYRRNSFGLESSLETSVKIFDGFWITPSIQYNLPVFERTKYPPFKLKYEQYINFALFLKFDF